MCGSILASLRKYFCAWVLIWTTVRVGISSAMRFHCFPYLRSPSSKSWCSSVVHRPVLPPSSSIIPARFGRAILLLLLLLLPKIQAPEALSEQVLRWVRMLAVAVAAGPPPSTGARLVCPAKRSFRCRKDCARPVAQPVLRLRPCIYRPTRQKCCRRSWPPPPCLTWVLNEAKGEF